MACAILIRSPHILPDISTSTPTARLISSFGRFLGEDTLYPEGLETVPKKFAINKRNEWMILNSDISICYVYKTTGGAAKFKGKAEKKGLRIISL